MTCNNNDHHCRSNIEIMNVMQDVVRWCVDATSPKKKKCIHLQGSDTERIGRLIGSSSSSSNGIIELTYFFSSLLLRDGVCASIVIVCVESIGTFETAEMEWNGMCTVQCLRGRGYGCVRATMYTFAQYSYQLNFNRARCASSRAHRQYTFCLRLNFENVVTVPAGAATNYEWIFWQIRKKREEDEVWP